MSSTPALYQSANSSTSTLRPRNPRLISYVDDGNEEQAAGRQIQSASASTTSTFSARAVSPVNTVNRAQSVNKKSTELQRHVSHNRSASASARGGSSGGIWDSWSSIQGIASTFLSNEASGDVSRKRSKGKKPTWMKQDKHYGISQSQRDWGPPSENKTLVIDSQTQERQSLVQAKKREALLLSSAQDSTDSLGRYKRKDSDSNFHAAKSPESDGDVLVYRHKVGPLDTLAGVTIKYSCQPEIFKKVNRFWPNDNIQRRKQVLLPVEACSVRGRKVDNLHDLNQLKTEDQSTKEQVRKEDDNRKLSLENGSFAAFPETEPISSLPYTPHATTEEPDDEYRHDSWVQLPSFAQPVEILRMSRQTLGYFPPTRRKSNPPVFVDSPSSTPKSSFDLLRHPPTHAAQQAVLQNESSVSFDASPSRRPILPPHLNSAQRLRSSSTASAPGSSSNGFGNMLRGPGGVGTLRGLRTETARPGPGEDPLNKKFAQYIPDLLPPEEELLSANFARNLAMTPSLRGTPRASTDSIRSSRSNSSTMPAAIEGWMRKFTGSSASTGATSPLRRRGDGNREAMTGSMGDLIELEVNTDSYFGSADAEEEELTPRPMPRSKVLDNSARLEGKSDEELLNDRFPVRGRIRRAYENE